jgi:ATP-dependent RNA helicase RhlE
LAREIVELAESILQDPIHVSVAPQQPTVEAIEQGVYFVSTKKKQALLEKVLADPRVERTLIFTRTKRGANRVVKDLRKAGIEVEPIHGNKSQAARQKALKQFRDGFTKVLVATDVVSRGIDIDDITHVIQFDLPHEPEVYVHRIGRTGRAGADGIAISFCSETEQKDLKAIEKLIKMKVPVIQDRLAR